ncbi:hypothetical protein LTR97_007085 [Elasticomyces elasticus]|uniref:C2H2-type domain-containing protein n=1 Tax=Elasticomyces elasticus TaxID=574655 RepID=A0AAN7WA16_9PEZI|nr:hypothetical protein LTR97_007085 [Elasticomyces elasticus]
MKPSNSSTEDGQAKLGWEVLSSDEQDTSDFCDACERTYNSERAYKRHLNTNIHRLAIGEPLAPTITCGLCDKTFTRHSDLKRHETQNRCRFLTGTLKQPRTVLGKRAFDETTQSSEQKDMQRLSPIQGLGERVSEWLQDDPSYTLAAGTWQVATQEQPTLALSKPSESLDGVLDLLTKRGEEMVIPGGTTAQEEDCPPVLTTKPLLWLYSDRTPLLSDAMAAYVDKLFEPCAGGPLYATEVMSSPSVVIDYKWVDDLTGHYELVDFDSFQELNGVDATEREVEDSGSQLPTILESPADEAGPDYTAGTTMIDTNLKQEPRMSSKTRLQHILEDPVVLPPKRLRGRQPLRLEGQKCSLCKKPYEKNGMALRQHLEAHLTELRVEQATDFCEVCQIGFARPQDLQHHNNTAGSGKCCGLALNHVGACEGSLCGFNFSHAAPCNGHHPPTDDPAVWSDHDRFKFGHLLRKWELSQLRVAAAEANKAQRLQQVAERIGTLSVPGRGCGELTSEAGHSTSVVSWRSEPFGIDAEVGELQLGLMGLNVNGSKPRRNIMESRPIERLDAEEHLISAGLTNNNDIITEYVERDDSVDPILAPAAERGPIASPHILSWPATVTEQEVRLALVEAARRGELVMFSRILAGRAAPSIDPIPILTYAAQLRIPLFLGAFIKDDLRFMSFDQLYENYFYSAISCGDVGVAVLLSMAESFAQNGQLQQFLSRLEPGMSYEDMFAGSPPRLSAPASTCGLIIAVVKTCSRWSVDHTTHLMMAILPNGSYELSKDVAREVIEAVVTGLSAWPEQAKAVVGEVIRMTAGRNIESLLPLHAEATRDVERGTKIGMMLMEVLPSGEDCDLYFELGDIYWCWTRTSRRTRCDD